MRRPPPDAGLMGILGAGLLAGCSVPDRLEDTPIIGGTPEVRAVIRDELASFDEATGGGRTRVRKIKVQELEDALGQFDQGSLVVHLDDDLPPSPEVSYDPHGPGVRQVLRHELCHALDRVENLHRERDAYAGRAAEMPQALYYRDSVCHGEECVQSEVFALYCELGPWRAQTAAGCESEPATDGVRILRQLADELWIGADDIRPTVLEPDLASIDADALFGHSEVEVLTPWTSPQFPNLVRLRWMFFPANVQQDVYADWRSGSIVELSSEDDAAFLDTMDFHPAAPPSLEGSTSYSSGSAGGLFVANVDMTGFDESAIRRSVWYDGERWWLTGDGCPTQPTPFTTDRVFTLRVDGTRIPWGSVAPP